MEKLNIDLIKRLMEIADDLVNSDKEDDGEANFNSIVLARISGSYDERDKIREFRKFLDGVSFEEMKSVIALRYIGKNRVGKSHWSPYEVYDFFKEYVDTTVKNREDAVRIFIYRYRFFSEDIKYALEVLDIGEEGVLSEMKPSEKRGGVHCKYCEKELLEEASKAIINFVRNEDEKIIRIVACCKGACDDMFLSEIKEGEYDFFVELENFTTPMLFVRECLNMMTKIHNGRGFESEDVLDEYQNILCYCSAFITREMTERERQRVSLYGLL